MKPNLSRNDHLMASLLTGIMGAFGFGMIPWMMDAGTRWIVGFSTVGFALVALSMFLFGDSIARFNERNEQSWTGTSLFGPTFGLVPAFIGLIVGIILIALIWSLR